MRASGELKFGHQRRQRPAEHSAMSGFGPDGERSISVLTLNQRSWASSFWLWGAMRSVETNGALSVRRIKLNRDSPPALLIVSTSFATVALTDSLAILTAQKDLVPASLDFG